VLPATSSSADDNRPDIERGLLDDDDGLPGRQCVTMMTSFLVVWSSGCDDTDVLLGRQGVTTLTSFSVVRVWSASQIFKKKIPRPWVPSVGDGVSSRNLMYKFDLDAI
jgi:hypothetical protein